MGLPSLAFTANGKHLVRCAPAAMGWLLLVGGVLNLLSGLTPAGLFTTLLGITSGLAEAGAIAGYGWTIIGSTRHHSQAG